LARRVLWDIAGLNAMLCSLVKRWAISQDQKPSERRDEQGIGIRMGTGHHSGTYLEDQLEAILPATTACISDRGKHGPGFGTLKWISSAALSLTPRERRS
jgi:hypothetical protein